MHFPIGNSDFRKIRESKALYVDKTMFIYDIFSDHSEAVLILRPRRFGKTLNLSTLHYFLSATVRNKPTKGLFKDLAIAATEVMREQGNHPVVFISFKDMNSAHLSNSVSTFRDLVSELYREHQYLCDSASLDEGDRALCRNIILKKSEVTHLAREIYTLTRLLSLHHKKGVWVLIDEYDAPLHAAYQCGYYDEMLALMRESLAPLLKDNPYLSKAVLTGILRISKESLFSGVNNLEVYSMLEAKYAEHYGFTQEEVYGLLCQSHLLETQCSVKEWYNGYQVGNVTLYNPWSISKYIKEQGRFDLYWVNTADDSLLQRLIMASKESFQHQFEALLQGGSVVTSLDLNITFSSLMNSEDALWSFLFLSGHLKVIRVEQNENDKIVTFKLPNDEIRRLFRSVILKWLAPQGSQLWFNSFIESLLLGDVEAFALGLREMMQQVVSYHDTASNPECFYHGLMIGLTAYLFNHPDYVLSSNRESGLGRYDYMIRSRNHNKCSILIEFKRYVPSKKSLSAMRLSELLIQQAEAALQQINRHCYDLEAAHAGVTRWLKIGIAFCGKSFEVRSSCEG